MLKHLYHMSGSSIFAYFKEAELVGKEWDLSKPMSEDSMSLHVRDYVPYHFCKKDNFLYYKSKWLGENNGYIGYTRSPGCKVRTYMQFVAPFRVFMFS